MIGCDGRPVRVGDAVRSAWREAPPTHRVSKVVDGPEGYVGCEDGRTIPANIFKLAWRRLGWSNGKEGSSCASR